MFSEEGSEAASHGQRLDEPPEHFQMLMRAQILNSLDRPTLQLNNEDIIEDDSGPDDRIYHLYKASKLLEQDQKAVADINNDDHSEDEESEDSSTSSMRKMAFDTKQITDEARTKVIIKDYTMNYRKLFDDPAKPAESALAKPGNFGMTSNKISFLRQKGAEERLAHSISHMSECEKIDLISKIIPEFSSVIDDLYETRLKYNILLKRVRKVGGTDLIMNLSGDEKMNELQILNELQAAEGGGIIIKAPTTVLSDHYRTGASAKSNQPRQGIIIKDVEN